MTKMIHSQSLQPFFSAYGASPAAVLEHPSLDNMDFDGDDGYNFVVVPVEDADKMSMNAIRYAKILSGEIVAVHILLNPFDSDGMEYRWKLQHIDIPLIILESPDGSLIWPLTAFVDGIRSSHKESVVTIILPVLITLKWWHRFLHNQSARLIERAFQEEAGVVTSAFLFSWQMLLVKELMADSTVQYDFDRNPYDDSTNE